MPKFNTITRTELISIMDYDPRGFLVWKNPLARRNKKGQRVGYDTNGYRQVSIKGKLYREHRLVWLFHYGNIPECDVDHINRIRNDNRIENLRLCTDGTLQNSQNRSLNVNNKSGVKGVYWNKNANKWHTRIGVNGKRINIGYYENIEDAKNARKEADKKYHPFCSN